MTPGGKLSYMGMFGDQDLTSLIYLTYHLYQVQDRCWLLAILEAGRKEISLPQGVHNVFTCTAPAEPSEHRLVLVCLQGAAQLCLYSPLMSGQGRKQIPLLQNHIWAFSG